MGLVLLVLAAVPSVAADEVPDATIELTGGAFAAGIGYAWGRGRLIYHGRLFRLKVNRLSIAEVGVSSYIASGDVYNLEKPSDILRTYMAITVGATVGGRSYGNVDAERAWCQDPHDSDALRAGLTLASAGMTISAARERP